MKGIKEVVSKNGQLVVDVSCYEDDWNKRFNGKYVLDRVTYKHRGLAAKLLKGMNTGNTLPDLAQELVRKRHDGTQVKDVMLMIQNGGEGLTEEEQDFLNQKVSGGFDIEEMFGNDASLNLIKEFLVESPVNLKTDEDFEDLELSLGNYLFQTCMHRLITQFNISEERQKK